MIPVFLNLFIFMLVCQTVLLQQELLNENIKLKYIKAFMQDDIFVGITQADAKEMGDF